MNCKRCGSLLTENDQFCKNCGAAVNELNAQQNMVNEQSTQVQPSMGYNNQPFQNGIGGQVQNNYPQSEEINNYNSQSNFNQMNQGMLNGQPQNNFGQQGEINGYNSQLNNNQIPQKNKDNKKFIMLGIIIVLVIVAVVFVAIKFIGNKGNSNLLGNNDSENVNNSSSYKVNFKGFTFNIPDNLIYEESSNALLIGNEEGTWVTELALVSGNFSQLKANKSQLQSSMQQSGFTSTAAELKNIGNVEYITLELTHSGQQAIAAYAKLNSMNIVGVVAYSQDNEFDYSLLEEIAPIIKSAKYIETTNNMKNDFKIDMSEIEKIAK